MVKWFNNAKMSVKLVIGFFISAVLIALIGIFGIYNLSNIVNNDSALYNEHTMGISTIHQLNDNFLKVRITVRSMVLFEGEDKAKDAQTVSTLLSNMTSKADEYYNLSTSQISRDNITELKALISQYTSTINAITQSVVNGENSKMVLKQITATVPMGNKLDAAITKIINYNLEQAKKKADSNKNNGNNATIVMIAIVVAGFVISILLGLIISSLINRPIKALIHAARNIAKGDMNIEIDTVRRDEIGDLGRSFETMTGSIKALIEDANMLEQAALQGRLSTRADGSKHEGSYRNIIEGVNNTLEAVITPLNVAADYVDKISKGNIPVKITDHYNGDFNLIKNNLNTCIDNVNALVTDANMLSEAALMGQLSTRADATKHGGDFRKIVEGVNQTLDAVINPLNVAADYVDKISKGDIPAKITDPYNGDFNLIKNNLNACIDNVNALVQDANSLSMAAIEGKLSTRADATRHSGDFRRIVEGVNHTLDSVINPLNVAADYIERISKGNIPDKITDSYNGDFNKIKNNLNFCIDNINALVTDTNQLVQAALDGKLSTRANVDKHSGDYRRIVEGVNMTLDAVIEPIREAAAVLSEMANGNLNVKVAGNYKGDHADIKNALNDTIDSLSTYINEIAEVLGEMSNSNLNLSIVNEYKGDFAQIKNALNGIIETYNSVFEEINNSSDQVASGSRQVSDGSQALAQGATEQASSVEELTASITQVSAQTKENAVNANAANELALAAKGNAVQGNEHMNGMLSSMKDINEASSNISKIIKVIDDIAFQTNILALNAAVEAARAGQHGKGFAVVAEEVRNLAARSANAAKETTALIEGTIKRVEAGTQIANDTAKSLVEIVDGVAKAAALVGDIANASNEQASAISQINRGIEQVSKVVQTNSATAEESAAASEELSSQAELLKNMISKFKLKRTMSASLAVDRGHSGYPERESSFSHESLRQSTRKKTKVNGNGRASKIALSDIEFGKY